MPSDKIQKFADAWIPMESTMYDLSEKTTSVLHVDRVVENPEIDDRCSRPTSSTRSAC